MICSWYPQAEFQQQLQQELPNTESHQSQSNMTLVTCSNRVLMSNESGNAMAFGNAVSGGFCSKVGTCAATDICGWHAQMRLELTCATDTRCKASFFPMHLSAYTVICMSWYCVHPTMNLCWRELESNSFLSSKSQKYTSVKCLRRTYWLLSSIEHDCTVKVSW